MCILFSSNNIVLSSPAKNRPQKKKSNITTTKKKKKKKTKKWWNGVIYVIKHNGKTIEQSFENSRKEERMDDFRRVNTVTQAQYLLL